MPRLFTGLEIPAEVGQTLSNLRGGLPGARWIDPENYHVTLRFIGDIDGMSANEIASMLFRVNRKPFEVKLQGLMSFGGRKPRAVVATIAPSKPLIELQAELERMMQRIGLDPEGRKFIPHVTLARLHDASDRDVADYLSLRGYFPSKAFLAEHYQGLIGLSAYPSPQFPPLPPLSVHDGPGVQPVVFPYFGLPGSIPLLYAQIAMYHWLTYSE